MNRFGFGLSSLSLGVAAIFLLTASAVIGAALGAVELPSGTLTQQRFAAIQAANTLLTNPSSNALFADGFEVGN